MADKTRTFPATWNLNEDMLRRLYHRWRGLGHKSQSILRTARQHSSYRPVALRWTELKWMWRRLGLPTEFSRDERIVRQTFEKVKAQAHNKHPDLADVVMAATSLLYIMENNIDLTAEAKSAFGDEVVYLKQEHGWPTGTGMTKIIRCARKDCQRVAWKSSNFCSERCRELYKARKRKCKYCDRPLPIPEKRLVRHRVYCNETCRKRAYRENARIKQREESPSVIVYPPESERQ